MWRFQLCSNPPFGSTADATLIGELHKAKNRQVELLLNRPGSVKFNISLEEEIAASIKEGETCIKAWRDDIYGTQQLRWSGPVWTCDEDLANRQLSVSAVGWFEELNKRLIRDTQAATARYSAVDPGAIVLGGNGVAVASSLLGLANAQTDSGGVVRPTHVNAGTYDLTLTSLGVPVTRTINYESWQNIGQAIQALSDIENGFDIKVDPLTRQLNLYHGVVKAGSTVYGYGQDRPNALFTLGWGPRNLASLSRQSDMASVANRVTATGTYGSAMADDTGSESLYGIFEEQVAVESGDANVLLAYAGVEVTFRAKPQPVWSLVPFAWSEDSNVPRLFDDYDVGDFVYLMATGGRQNMTSPQALRVFGVTLNVDEEGNEKISSLQVAPAT